MGHVLRTDQFGCKSDIICNVASKFHLTILDRVRNMSNKGLVRRNPFSVAMTADTDTRVLSKCISSGSSKKRAQERRSMDNARKFQYSQKTMYLLNGECRTLEGDEFKAVRTKLLVDMILSRKKRSTEKTVG